MYWKLTSKVASTIFALAMFTLGIPACTALIGLDDGPVVFGPCIDDDMCDDHNVCTVDRCGADAECTNEPCISCAPDDDAKACMDDLCENGNLVSHLKLAGTECSESGGKVCDGAGACVECIDPAQDCTAPVDPCKVAACNAGGECIDESAADGMLAGTQTDGDCKKSVCVGGMVGSENDDDPLDDGNDCTIDSCEMGAPKTMPTGTGTPCMGTKVCDGMGACFECLVSANCADPLKTICDQNVCVNLPCSNKVKDPNETDKDCGGVCAPCADLDACLIPSDCTSGVCMTLICQAPTCVDNVTNGAETDKDCGGDSGCPKCKANKDCNEDGDCVGNQCTGMAGTCVPNCNDTDKNGAETDVDCGGGACDPCGVGKECAGSDPNCVADAFCNAISKCALDLPNGQTCMGAGQCTSGICTDDVCCNMACMGPCQACDIGGNKGSCSNISNGLDPDMECAGAEFCNGVGACSKALGASCVLGGECSSTFCADGVCCDGACGGLCRACTMAKTGQAAGTCANVTMNTDPESECAGVLTCAAGGECSTPLAQGAACSFAAECASTNCVDGFCCNTTCIDVCRACNVSGAQGTCSAVISGNSDALTCSAPSTCNGSGTCQKVNGQACMGPAGCQSGNCVDDVCCDVPCTGTCQACSTLNKGSGASGTCGNIDNNYDPNAECEGVASCNGGGLCQAQANGGACTNIAECLSSDCVDGVCCGSSSCGICQACNTPSSPGTCSSVKNQEDDTCSGTSTCNGNGVCKVENGGACLFANVCFSNICVGNCLGKLADPCLNNTDCASNDCSGSPLTCQKGAANKPCGASADCISNVCLGTNHCQ